MPAITELIAAANRGEAGAVDGLFALLYPELRKVAHGRLRGAGVGSLSTTALVHESFLRLVSLRELRVEDRGHFLSYAGRVMRSVVVDLAREAKSARRGGAQPLHSLDTGGATVAAPESNDEVLQVHDALEKLATVDERLVRVVELRYFMGLEMDEIAQTLGVGKRTVERDWEKARSFLFATLERD